MTFFLLLGLLSILITLILLFITCFWYGITEEHYRMCKNLPSMPRGYLNDLKFSLQLSTLRSKGWCLLKECIFKLFLQCTAGFQTTVFFFDKTRPMCVFQRTATFTTSFTTIIIFKIYMNYLWISWIFPVRISKHFKNECFSIEKSFKRYFFVYKNNKLKHGSMDP